jgi:hypothetical protein
MVVMFEIAMEFGKTQTGGAMMPSMMPLRTSQQMTWRPALTLALLQLIPISPLGKVVCVQPTGTDFADEAELFVVGGKHAALQEACVENAPGQFARFVLYLGMQ